LLGDLSCTRASQPPALSWLGGPSSERPAAPRPPPPRCGAAARARRHWSGHTLPCTRHSALGLQRFRPAPPRSPLEGRRAAAAAVCATPLCRPPCWSPRQPGAPPAAAGLQSGDPRRPAVSFLHACAPGPALRTVAPAPSTRRRPAPGARCTVSAHLFFRCTGWRGKGAPGSVGREEGELAQVGAQCAACRQRARCRGSLHRAAARGSLSPACRSQADAAAAPAHPTNHRFLLPSPPCHVQPHTALQVGALYSWGVVGYSQPGPRGGGTRRRRRTARFGGLSRRAPPGARALGPRAPGGGGGGRARGRARGWWRVRARGAAARGRRQARARARGAPRRGSLDRQGNLEGEGVARQAGGRRLEGGGYCGIVCCCTMGGAARGRGRGRAGRRAGPVAPAPASGGVGRAAARPRNPRPAPPAPRRRRGPLQSGRGPPWAGAAACRGAPGRVRARACARGGGGAPGVAPGALKWVRGAAGARPRGAGGRGRRGPPP
jgi:hypothetical protein